MARHAPSSVHRDRSSFGFWCQLNRRPGHMDDAHAHADLELNYLVQGSMCYHAGGRELMLPARLLLLFWAELPHRSHHPE